MMITPGLLLAGSMRPTFWVLALAWGTVCVWGVLRGPRRRLYATCLILLLATWATVQAIDLRGRGFNPMSGGYEREAVELFPDVNKTFGQRTYSALRDQLPASFFGEQMAPVSIASSLVLLGSCLLLFRRRAVALMIFITFGITLILSTQPRYYTMVLPLMLLGWILMLMEIEKRLPRKWSGIALAIGLALIAGNNISASVSFIREQRSIPFLKHYKNGKYLTAVHMSDLIIKRVPRDGHVLGPSASLMTYISGIHVFSQREILGRRNAVQYPQALIEAGINYAVLPARAYRARNRSPRGW